MHRGLDGPRICDSGRLKLEFRERLLCHILGAITGNAHDRLQTVVDITAALNNINNHAKCRTNAYFSDVSKERIARLSIIEEE